MSWKIVATKTFSKEVRKYKKDTGLCNVLDKKIQRLKKNPNTVGGYLSGRLSGFKSTRILRKARLIFKIDEENRLVSLIGIDHRKFDYKHF